MQDLDDEMVLDAAINGRADVIVTHNRRDFLPAASHKSWWKIFCCPPA